MDFLLTSLTIILLLLGRFWLDLADVARLKNLFWLFEVDLSEVLEQWLICDFLSDLFERWVILELTKDLLDS